MKGRMLFLLFAAALFVIGAAEAQPRPGNRAELQISSPAFEPGGMMPRQYTCTGEDISPPLAWASVPDSTRSFALICDDPDAPMATWVHWVVFDIPAEVRHLPEGLPDRLILKNGARQGINDFGRIGYGGPCPPGGVHRYYFKLYALDSRINLAPGATKAQVLNAMAGHILAQGQLMGRYSR